MALVVRALHAASRPELLNEEFILLENTGPGMLHAKGWAILVGNKNYRPRSIGTLEPGFALEANSKVRLVTGSPAKKAWGAPPAEEAGIKNYYLFLREPVLAKPGIILTIALKQAELAKATFAPDKQDGLATE